MSREPGSVIPSRRDRRPGVFVALLCLFCLWTGCVGPPLADPGERAMPDAHSRMLHATRRVDTDRIARADGEPGNWMTVGRSYHEQYYSPLAEIDRENVDRLGLAWRFDLDTHRGQEATPLVVDGALYVVTAWNLVKALDAAEGEPVWEALTVEPGTGYNVTGAPRAAKGKVFIGNGGADNGLRGCVSAYDVDDGTLAWRFYTVPGDPADGQESPILEQIADTWSGEYWKQGGGGTAWDAIVYDPELDQLYIGVGNGGPWDPTVRSPGGGDNLFLASIVAVDAETGQYRWHYQQVPGDAWDYTATQPIVLADLEIEGRTRKVLMQAPKNGFFYVLDRRTGELISAETLVPINWAEPELDARGRPIVRPEARYYETGRPFLGSPGPAGAHNWMPMAYHPGTGLVYVPVTISPMVYSGLQSEGEGHGPDDASLADLPGFRAVDEELRAEVLAMNRGFLLAGDPARQHEVWRVDHTTAVNGGALATGGGLVFQGEANGELAAFDAETGEKLWAHATHGGIVAAPARYRVGGEQYVVLLQGWGGGFVIASGEESRLSGPKRNLSRVLAFKLDGDAVLPPPPPFPELDPPAPTGSAARIGAGRTLYASLCARCHRGNAVGGTTMPPDLWSSPALHDGGVLRSIVRGGELVQRGMPDFGEKLDADAVEAIRAYVIGRANASIARDEPREVRR